jgi:hypothetical protein
METPPKKENVTRYTYENRPLDSTGFEPIRVLVTMPRRAWERMDELRGETPRAKWLQEKILRKTR